MTPPAQNLNLDITAISGICGSISIACWVVVYSPQIIKNFQRSSTDGLSLQFIAIWLAGDFFNVLGAVLQGVLPTMIILGFYYTFCDIVLLGQCFYYRGFTWSDEVSTPKLNGVENEDHVGEPNEQTGLLGPSGGARERRRSEISVAHLSPAVPLIDENAPESSTPSRPATRLQSLLWNFFSIIMVCTAGVVGWYLSNRSQGRHQSSHAPSHKDDEVLQFSLWGQIFGYFCAVLYLGSRIPQILLNYRRKSTEGVSILFFMFACVGNLSYVLSIFAYDPSGHCAARRCVEGEAASVYGRYIAVNASWLAGSLGTLFLDFGIFLQFFLYSVDESAGNGEAAAATGVVTPRDQRPLLERGDSEVV